MTPRDKRHIQASNVISFLNGHPALNCMALSQLYFDIVKVNHRGHSNPGRYGWSVHYTPANYKKFKAHFDKEFKEYPEDEKGLATIHRPYKEVFGEPWIYSHVEYWGELNILMYDGKSPEHDRNSWQSCQGVETGGKSYEEMVINIGAKFKKIFGAFQFDDFLTPKEKANHKKEQALIFVDTTDKRGYSTMEHNPAYISVGPGELNHRWLKWFSKTPYGKENWGSSVKKIIAGIFDFNN